MTQVTTGTIIHTEPNPTGTFIKQQMDTCVDKGTEISRDASKHSVKAFVPIGFAALGEILKYCGVPESIYKRLQFSIPLIPDNQ